MSAPTVGGGNLQVAPMGKSAARFSHGSSLPNWSSAWMWRVVLTFCGRPLFFISALALSTAAAVCGILAPYFQKIFVDGLSGETNPASGALLSFLGVVPGLSMSLWPIAASVAALLAGQVFIWMLRQACARESAWVQQGLSSEIYGQSLHLHPHNRHKYSVGELVTFFAQDVSAAGSLVEDCLPQILSSIFPLILAPLAIGFVFDLHFGSVALVAGLGIAVCCFLAWRQAGLFVRYKDSTQDRMAVVNEWLQNLKLLRVSGRIQGFEQDIYARRQIETERRIAMVTNASTMNACAQVLPQLINIVGLAVLIASRREALTAGEVFGLLWVFGVFLNMPLRQLPWGLVMAVDGLSSLERIRFFMLEKSIDSFEVSVAGHFLSSGVLQAEASSLRVEGLQVFAANGELLLDVPFLSVEEGEFIAVVGEVGSGKSLLFSALIGEIEPRVQSYRAGELDLKPVPVSDWRHLFCLVPQGGFVMNANLRRNLSLEYGEGLPDDGVLRNSLLLADFDPERERLPGGLDQPLGERGVNLSGGQRQRLGLARAVQFDRPIILLDDSLSAVDVETEKTLLQGLLLGHWQHKTRILATHRLSALSCVSRILFLKEGRAIGYGTLAELMRESEDFRHFFNRQQEESLDEG
jgi:ATP-binding cassette subfamily B multidrug efflux pump